MSGLLHSLVGTQVSSSPLTTIILSVETLVRDLGRYDRLFLWTNRETSCSNLREKDIIFIFMFGFSASCRICIVLIHLTKQYQCFIILIFTRWLLNTLFVLYAKVLSHYLSNQIPINAADQDDLKLIADRDDVISYLSMSCGRSVRWLLLRSSTCRLLILRAQMGIDTNLFSAMSRWTSCFRSLSCRQTVQYDIISTVTSW